MNPLKIVFVLPTKNEEKTIEVLIRDLIKISRENGWQSNILIVDDSTDKTSTLAIELGAEVLSGESRGLGYSMLKGLAHAQKKDPDYIITLDSDGQVNTSEISMFIDIIQAEKLDVLLSSRFLKNDLIKYRYPLINYIGNRILVLILRYCTGFPFTDSHGGIRVMKPKTLEGLQLIGLHTYVQETLIIFCKNKFQVKELPSQWNVRKHSQSRVLKSMSQYILRTLPGLLYLMNFHKIFLFLSILIGIFYFLFKLDSALYILVTTLFLIFSVLIILHSKNAIHIKDINK